MKTPKKQKSIVDLTKPISLDQLNIPEGDCFGKLFDMTDRICILCADRTNCQNVFARIELEQRRLAESNGKKYLDEMVSINDIPNYFEGLKKLFIANNNKLPYNEVANYISSITNITDATMVRYQIGIMSSEHSEVSFTNKIFTLNE